MVKGPMGSNMAKSGSSQWQGQPLNGPKAKGNAQERPKIHGFSQPKNWENQVKIFIGKNRIPVDDKTPIFKTDYSHGLSLESLALIDAIFLNKHDLTEKARILHVLSNHLSLIEMRNIKYQMQLSKVHQDYDELKLQNLRLIERVKQYGAPHLKMQKAMLVSSSRLKFLEALPRDLAQQILCNTHLKYEAHLRDLYVMAHRSTYMKQGLFIKRAKIYESEYQKWTSEEISDMYAHGFIRTIQFVNNLPKGIPDDICKIIHENRYDGSTTIHIDKDTPTWDIKEGCRIHGDTTICIVPFDTTMDVNNQFEPAITAEFYTDKTTYESIAETDTIYKGSSAQGSFLEIRIEDLIIPSPGGPSEAGSYYDSDLERELCNRMDN
ncbi:p46 [Agapanthus tungrovirus]|uniref:p46 n=1 Tax=Agapanthus tungrovirus TaxID=2838078 RepID=A0A8E7KPX2_9VIRU|nr:p46 [Agapanthus tungrovirus]